MCTADLTEVSEGLSNSCQGFEAFDLTEDNVFRPASTCGLNLHNDVLNKKNWFLQGILVTAMENTLDNFLEPLTDVGMDDQRRQQLIEFRETNMCNGNVKKDKFHEFVLQHFHRLCINHYSVVDGIAFNGISKITISDKIKGLYKALKDINNLRQNDDTFKFADSFPLEERVRTVTKRLGDIGILMTMHVSARHDLPASEREKMLKIGANDKENMQPPSTANANANASSSSSLSTNDEPPRKKQRKVASPSLDPLAILLQDMGTPAAVVANQETNAARDKLKLAKEVFEAARDMHKACDDEDSKAQFDDARRVYQNTINESQAKLNVGAAGV